MTHEAIVSLSPRAMGLVFEGIEVAGQPQCCYHGADVESTVLHPSKRKPDTIYRCRNWLDCHVSEKRIMSVDMQYMIALLGNCG